MRLVLLPCIYLLSFAVSYAQTPKRVIGLSEKEWNGTGWSYNDTANLLYYGSRGNNFLSPEISFSLTGYDVANHYGLLADTIAFGEKEVLTYNTDDSITGRTLLSLDGAVWVNNTRNTYVYNGSKQLVLWLREQWNTGTNAWDSTSRVLYTYDNNNNRLSVTVDAYAAGNWQGDVKITNTFDGADNVLTTTGQNWSNGTWVNSYRHVSTYDANNNRITFNRENWGGGSWQPDERSTMTYNGSNKLTESLRESYQNGTWENSERHTYIRDSNGNATQYTQQNWINNAWQNYTRETATYNSVNKALTSLSEIGNGGAWTVLGRHMFGYDNDNKRTSDTAETWTGSAWVLDYRYEYPYDADGYWLGELTYDLVNGNEQLQQETRMFYEAYNPNGINDGTAISSSVYPNPAGQNTLLSFEVPQSGNVQWAVYDVNGQQLNAGTQYCTTGQQSVLLNLSNYAGGVYLYTVSTAQGNKAQGKIVKY